MGTPYSLKISAQYVRRLAENIQADVVWWSQYGAVDGAYVVLDVSMCSAHESVDDSAIKNFHGARLGRGSFADRSAEVLELRRGRWSLYTPSLVHLNRFALWDDEFTKPYVRLREQQVFRERKWVRSFYEAYDAYDQLRAFFFTSDGEALGIVSFWRCGSGLGFGRREQQLLNAELDLDLMRGLFHRDVEPSIDSSEYFVLDADGEVSWSHPHLDWWLTEPRLRRIEEEARDGSRQVVFRHCLVELTRLLDEQILCKVKPISSIQTTPLTGAAQQQREIASLLGSGATNVQIAEMLGTSPGSVSSSIRSLCKRFGVASRPELIVAVRDLKSL